MAVLGMYELAIDAIVRERADVLGVVPEDILISKLGMGENNLNFLVITGGKKFVFRIGMRARLESNMVREFRGLQMLPPDVGPRPLFIDKSKKRIPHIVSVLSYVEGKKVSHWTKMHLSLHAKKLALLHKKTFPFASDLRKKHARIDIHRQFMKQINSLPDVLTDQDVKFFLPKVSRFLQEQGTVVAELRKFSLIHGDMGVDNIIFCKGDLHYIDWEWVHIADPAIDVARLYFEDFCFLPWNIRLTGDRLNYYISEYLGHRPDKTLRVRMQVWNIYYLFLDMAYNKWKIKHYHEEKTGLPKRQYEIIAKLGSDSLRRRF